jgi:hypothetical protein
LDLKGKRRLKTFRTKHAAEDWAAETRVSMRRGVHIADSDSISVAEAGKLWLETGKENGLVRSSLKQNREHLDLHITPLIGDVKPSQLSVPSVRAFEADLRVESRSAAMTRKVIASLCRPRKRSPAGHADGARRRPHPQRVNSTRSRTLSSVDRVCPKA